MKLTLSQALRVDSSSIVAFVGTGGKTTALFQLARQLPAPVIVTASSHLGAWQVGMADQHIMTDTAAPLEGLEHSLKGVILVTGRMDEDRTRPVNDDVLRWLHEFCRYHSIPLLIEADGARQKALKAWAENEPPIPSFATQVVQVVGLAGLNKPLNNEYVHRPQIFSRLSGLGVGEPITLDALANVLIHTQGGLKNLPAHARRLALLNQADTHELQSVAQELAQSLIPAYHSVIISSLKQESVFAVHEPVAGIILAAGESTRFGKPKQLLDWHGQPFVRAVAKTALKAGLSPVIVVTGANSELVESALGGLDVKITKNEDWKSGQGSSIKAGLLTLSSTTLQSGETCGGAIFPLSDQPQLTASILRALVGKHAEGLYPIVAPMVLDQRANPVLFDRSTFPDLIKLEGDVGGRAIFHGYRVEYLPWHDDRLLLDVDTPEMYQRLISDETL